jgi:Zn-dependent membrane protease YugP
MNAARTVPTKRDPRRKRFAASANNYEGEKVAVGEVLNAAALTYAAGTLTAVLQLLNFMFRAGLCLFRGRA